MADQTNTQKHPDDWVTGDEPMTGAQKSYLETMTGEAGEPVEDDFTKADASKKIDELQEKRGRGGWAVGHAPLAGGTRQPADDLGEHPVGQRVQLLEAEELHGVRHEHHAVVR